MRFLVTLLVLLCSAVTARAGQSAALERGTAIIDPLALRELDHGRFGLGRVSSGRRDRASADHHRQSVVRAAGDGARPQGARRRVRSLHRRHKSDLPNESIGVGTGFDFQLFDRALLYSADTRFVLAGIVNRMDRAYLSEGNCGEIRLIYRLTRISAAEIGENAVSPRLPMTLNVVLKAKGDHDARRQRYGHHLRRHRAAMARRRRSVADRDGACGKTGVKGRPAGSDPAGKYRPH